MNSLRQRDRQVLWHPATHFCDLDQNPPIPISGARGAWLFDDRKEPILDAIASWWTSVHGHCHPQIVKAIQNQVSNLDHVMFAGFTHEPAIKLAESLINVAPEGYGKVFFSDCGSASIEIAMKLSYQARILTGESQRNRFATLDNGYHGETLGALSVCGSDQYHHYFRPLLLDVLHLPCPKIAGHQHGDLEYDDSTESKSQSAATGGVRVQTEGPVQYQNRIQDQVQLRDRQPPQHPTKIQSGAASNGQTVAQTTEAAIALLREHAHQLTAIVLEPLVQCAGQMAMHGTNYYRRIVETAQQLGIHVIADEIAVGFCRTGKIFASQWTDCLPDFLCLSKGLSGGTLPLACTLIRSGFERHFAADPSRSFLHSHTFTANPIACAAANANLDLITERGFSSQINQLVATLQTHAREVTRHCPQINNMRQCGTIVAFDLNKSLFSERTKPRLGLNLRISALKRGVLLRPLHDTLYWMPPLCIDNDALKLLSRVTCESIHEVLPCE